MAKAKNMPASKDETAEAAPPKESDHAAKIASQVLAKVGVVPRLERVEVSRHHNGKYRVNIWQEREPDKNICISTSSRIRLSYYLTVSDKGEIIDSNPPMTRMISRP